MDDAIFQAEFARFDALSVDELYAALAPVGSASDLNGRVVAGKEVMLRLMGSGRQHICKAYQERKTLVRDGADLAKALAEYLPTILGIIGLKLPVVPVAVLLIKVGLEGLCQDDGL